MLRPLLRRFCYTANTIRYRVEWPRIREAFEQAGPCGTLLDGGAGSGEFSRCALRAGFCQKVVAVEYATHNFIQLRRNLGRMPNAELHQGSLLELPLPDASVDAVLCTQVLEHIAEHGKAAAELSRVLKPGGYAIITVPHPPEPFPNDDHVREGYTEQELAALFAPFGWTPLRTDYFLTRDTTRRMVRSSSLPGRGVYVPVAYVDRERKLDARQRRDRQPFGILMLFRKPDSAATS
jgi:SAM-dependent methyltransferase